MFETGARISEILELTMGDYRTRTDQHEFAATNKGSYKRRIKFIRISPETLKLLIRYVNTERQVSSKSLGKFYDLSDDEPLFLSKRGTPYSYTAFYSNWSRIVKAAGIKLNPHKARHWFVTSMLRGIYESSDTSSQIEEKKKQLVEYMKWRDPETLNVYEHYFDEQKFKDLHQMLQNNYNEREKEYIKSQKKNEKKRSNAPKREVTNNETPIWLDEFFEGMD